MRKLVLLPALVALVAASELPDTAPVPPDNPQPADSSSEQSAPASAEGAKTSGSDASPAAEAKDTARERTGDGTTAGDPDAGTGEDETDLADPATAPDQRPEPVDEAAIARCETELRALGAVFERRDTIDGDGTCGVYKPYNLREAAPGVIVKPDTELTCAAALATARWVRDEVLPATQALGDDVELSVVAHASTYVCRTRNNQPDAKISEHARGAAIDIASFNFEGHDPIPVVPRAGKGTIEEAFQRSVRAGACMHFTTVLGPGTDEYHDNHLHMDLAERKGDYRLCQ